MEAPANEIEETTGAGEREILATTDVEEPKRSASENDNPMMQDKEDDQKEIQFFKSSVYPVAPEILEFLKKQTTGIAYNKYCIDCKQKKTTHFVVWTGTFVCEKCADLHSKLCGESLRNCYTK